MKVVITGGTGLIGRALSHKLAGDDVVILSRSGKRPEGLPASARMVQWDGKTGSGWSQELDDTDAIVNLAGENIGGSRWTASHKQRIYESRINAGRAIIDAVDRSGHAPSTLIQASGVNYYGHRDETRLTESEPPGEGFLTHVCIDWEQSTAPLARQGTRHVITRNAVVLDASDGALPLLALPFRFFVGGRIGSGEQGFSWIHVDDYVNALSYLLHNDEIEGPVNVSAPNPVSNQEFTRALSSVLGRPALFPVPAFVLKIVVGEFADHLINGQFVVPRRLLDAGFEFEFGDVDSALRDLLG